MSRERAYHYQEPGRVITAIRVLPVVEQRDWDGILTLRLSEFKALHPGDEASLHLWRFATGALRVTGRFTDAGHEVLLDLPAGDWGGCCVDSELGKPDDFDDARPRHDCIGFEVPEA